MENELYVNHQSPLKTRAAVTSYPGVEIDLQSNNAAELRIPWSSTFDAVSLTYPDSDTDPVASVTAVVHLVSLSPMLTADPAATVSLSVFGWFENIELKGPTPRVVSVDFQGAKEARGPITEISSKISSAGKLLADVPVVGSIASSVSWVSDLVSGVASIFGWSRPVKGSGSDAFVNIPGRGFTNFKAEDAAVVLGMAADNSVGELVNNFLEEVDEMDIQHIAGRPALCSVTNWNTSDPHHQNLAQMIVGPNVEIPRTKTWNVGGILYDVYDMSLFELLATQFGMWRADIHFRVSVVRTAFHVGRLEVIFVPGALVSGAEVSTLDTTNTWRHIFDITEQSELEFTVPYMHKNVMCRSGVTPGNTGYTTGPDGYPGTFIVRSLTKLSAPSTVSQNVQINVWKWASNVAFSSPIAMPIQNFPWIPTSSVEFQGDVDQEGSVSGDNVTKSVVRVVTEAVRVVFQGILENSPIPTSSVAFGSMNSPKSLLDATSTVGGEMVTNLRQATRAHRFIQQSNSTTFPVFNELGNQGVSDYLSLCANIFTFYRGGLSYKIVPSTASDVRSVVKSSLARLTDAGVPTQGATTYASPTHLTFTDLNPFHEIQVPFYSASRRALCNQQMLTLAPSAQTKIQPCVWVENASGVTLDVWRAGKDDLTFGFLIGPAIYGINKGPAPSATS